MDTELRFISSLLRSNKTHQDKFYAQQIPRGIFRLREVEISWIYKFRQQHGVYPSATAFEAKFKEKLPRVSDPVPACLQPLLDLAMFNQMSDLTLKVKERLDAGGDTSSALSLFKEGATKLTAYTADYSDNRFASNADSLTRYKKFISDLSNGRLNFAMTPWPAMNKIIGQ